MGVMELAGVALAALLTENFILVTCMGVGNRTQCFRDPADALRTGGCLTVVMVLGALCAWLLDFLVLERFGWQFLRLLILALLILGIVAGLRHLLRTCVPELSRRMDDNLAAVSSNCAALGAALLVARRGYDLGPALVFALFGGIGTALALACFAALWSQIDLEDCPKAFQGIPMMLLTAGLMALALMGFYGLHIG